MDNINDEEINVNNKEMDVNNDNDNNPQYQENLRKMSSFLDDINKLYKAPLMKRGKKDFTELKKVPSKVLTLNWSLYGGIPEGVLIEYFGLEGSGKSTLALDTVAQFQKKYPNKFVLYADTESSLSEAWGEKFGVNFDKLVQLVPLGQAAEDVLQTVLDAITTDSVSLVVIDSIAAMFTKHEQASNLDDSLKVGGLASTIQRFVNKVVPLLRKHDCTVVCINQQRDKIGAYVPTLTTTGGHAFKYACSLRIELKKATLFDGKGVEVAKSNVDIIPCGHVIKYYLAKNKVSRDDRKHGQFNLYYNEGLNPTKDLWTMLKKRGVVHNIKGKIQLDDITVMLSPTITKRPILIEVDTVEQMQAKLKEDEKLFNDCYNFIFTDGEID